MAWAAGTFSRAGGATNWADDRDASTEIEAGLHDTHDEDLATGINACLVKDGTNAMTGDLNFGNNKGINLTDPTAAQDAATKAYVDTGGIFLASNDEMLCRLATHTTVPAGFTIGTVDDKAVKITGNEAASADGGSVAFSSAFTATTATTTVSGHAHTADGTLAAAASASGTFTYTPGGVNTVMTNTHTHDVTGTTSTAGSHSHTTNLAVNHRDFHIIIKT